jgi:hypothetical protein
MHRPQGVLIMRAKVTKLIQWKHLYMWFLQRINMLKPLKTGKKITVSALW